MRVEGGLKRVRLKRQAVSVPVVTERITSASWSRGNAMERFTDKLINAIGIFCKILIGLLFFTLAMGLLLILILTAFSMYTGA